MAESSHCVAKVVTFGGNIEVVEPTVRALQLKKNSLGRKDIQLQRVATCTCKPSYFLINSADPKTFCHCAQDNTTLSLEITKNLVLTKSIIFWVINSLSLKLTLGWENLMVIRKLDLV